MDLLKKWTYYKYLLNTGIEGETEPFAQRCAIKKAEPETLLEKRL